MLSRQEDERLIKNDILQLILTVPGERVMRPTIGSYLRFILFENINRVTGLRARTEVFRAIGLWEPRVSVQDVLFELEDTTITLHVYGKAIRGFNVYNVPEKTLRWVELPAMP